MLGRLFLGLARAKGESHGKFEYRKSIMRVG